MLGILKKKKLLVHKEDDMRTIEIQPEEMITPVVETVAVSHIGTRKYQQDMAYVSGSLYESGLTAGVLCDGMGGMEHGELVSTDVVDFFKSAFLLLREQQDNIPEFLEHVAYESNNMVLEKYTRQGIGAGTTLASVVLNQDQLYWVSIGDSRIYIIRNHEIARLTRDHNYALQLDELVENGKLSQEEALMEPQREALISYIGAPTIDVIDLARTAFQLEREDLIVVCSDGLTKSLQDEKILEFFENPFGDLQESAHRLIATALDAGNEAKDNITVILIRYIGEN